MYLHAVGPVLDVRLGAVFAIENTDNTKTHKKICLILIEFVLKNSMKSI